MGCFGKECDFSCKNALLALFILQFCGQIRPEKLCSGIGAGLFFAPFWDWQAEFGEDFFHILPDPFAVLG